MIIAISDGEKFNQGDYGAIAGGLTNGISFYVKPGTGPEFRIIHTTNIKYNYELLAIIERHELTQFNGLPQTLSLYLDVVGEFGTYFVLEKDWKFIVRLNDNFTGLISHSFGIKGIEVI